MGTWEPSCRSLSWISVWDANVCISHHLAGTWCWSFFLPGIYLVWGTQSGSQEGKCDSRQIPLEQLGPGVGLWLPGEVSCFFPLSPPCPTSCWALLVCHNTKWMIIVTGLETLSNHLRKNCWYTRILLNWIQNRKVGDTKAVLVISNFPLSLYSYLPLRFHIFSLACPSYLPCQPVSFSAL